MEQKTEASQAVDDLDALASRLSRIHDACLDNRPKQAVGEMICAAQNMPEWNRVRAALKAQPVPTEVAQGEDSARLDAERYRWLCEKYGVTWFPCFLEQKLECGYIADGKESIDATIDRARASAETGGVKP